MTLQRLDKIRISIRAQNQMGKIKHDTGVPINVLARFGLCMSLNDLSIPNPDMYDEKGMELLPHIMFGKNEVLYAAMLQQRVDDDGLDWNEHGTRMVRAHVNRGAGMLFPRIKKIEDFATVMGGSA